MLCWPGDLLVATGLARDCCAGFLAGDLVRAAVRPGSSWSARSVGARSGRARTNELDAGKRRPMIGSEEHARSRVAGWQGLAVPGCVLVCGVVSHAPIRRTP